MGISEAAKLLGVRKGCILRRFVRTGALPWPDPDTLTWDFEVINALVERFSAERSQRVSEDVRVGH